MELAVPGSVADREAMDDISSGTVHRVYQGLLADLDHGRMVPGQRLVETELAARFGAGRNAVREAIQRLAARGVVDLSRNRSPAIRKLDAAETMEVLTVAEAMTALVLGAAALHFVPTIHGSALDDAQAQIEAAADEDEIADFGRARRQFYRVLLEIGGNRELKRLFPAIGMHIVYAQYRSRRLRGIRLADYRAMIEAVRHGGQEQAEAEGRRHVGHVRAIIAEQVTVGTTEALTRNPGHS
ncbi:MAG: GntR family transcriptional regulator [Novosphingobium pentaromativorans]|uniref:GntR family transcriptional regulator n=2 Tax=Novosphingobium TaxID=165696 RepID=A0A2W5N916_9SPHN|nr:MAG: GntR family transcriptional regulator [Novosphingobium pentaromativorans]